MASKKANGRGHLKVYGAYVFRTKDPVIDEIRTEIEDHYGRRINYKDLRNIEENGGPSVGAMVGWFLKGIRRPANATVEAAGRAVGRKRVWVAYRTNK